MKKQTDECNFGGKVCNSVIRSTITVDEEEWFVSNILLGVQHLRQFHTVPES